MQEAASIIISYGGCVLKYIGDAVLGFFILSNTYGSEKMWLNIKITILISIACTCLV
jgi:class 3 adenylate cyclase